MYKRKKTKIDEGKEMIASDRNRTVEFPIQSPQAINRCDN